VPKGVQIRPLQSAPSEQYVVQVAAQKTEDEARASYQALQQKYPSVLSGHDPIIRRAELVHSGTWYRVHVGSFATAEQATVLCNSLKDTGGQCIVQKN
jgi:cell division protein FtsN